MMVVLSLIIAVSCSQQKTDEPTFDKAKAQEVLKSAAESYKSMMQSLPDSLLPRSIDSTGALVTSNTRWWCSGFYPGTLWLLYEQLNDTVLLNEAKKRTAYIEKEKFNKGTHDLGFMLYCSFGNGYRLTNEPTYKDIMLQGAQSLSTRYNGTIGCIKSWDHGKWQFPVIIDNMMNLEFLFWATKVSGDSSFYKLSVQHAQTTIKNHFRPDYSTYHVIDYDTVTGAAIQKVTHQGFSDESAWARGQAWGLYGYTVTYRETKDVAFLAQARNIAKLILHHPNLPADKIPYWDFNAPEIPNAKRDASAGAIIASALFELSTFVDGDEAKEYYDAALKMLATLSLPEYLAKAGENGNFILKHSVGSLPHNSEVDVPLSYADYYFVEAITRYLKLAK